MPLYIAILETYLSVYSQLHEGVCTTVWIKSRHRLLTLAQHGFLKPFTVYRVGAGCGEISVRKFSKVVGVFTTSFLLFTVS